MNGEEYERGTVQYIDLLQATDEELVLFKEQVTQNGGNLDVLVHAWYRMKPGGWKHRTITSDYPQKRDSLIGECLKNNTPLLLLTEPDELVRESLAIQGTGIVFMVPTKSNTHELIGGNSDWLYLVRLLTKSGVTHITVGGAWMQIYKSEFAIANLDENSGGDEELIREFLRKNHENQERFPRAAKWIGEDLIPEGCAGTVALHFLQSGFDVSISSAATPCAQSESGISYFEQEWSEPDLSREL